MKLKPLQTIILLVVLAGVIYGTYWATVDQLPDISGTVVGNTSNVANTTNHTIGTVYIEDTTKQTNTSIIITNNTTIYKETKDNKQVQVDMNQLKKGTKIDVFTIGNPTNTIPPQITAEKIIIKKPSQ